MIVVSKVVSSVIIKGYRIVKAILFGKTDVRESTECSPYGWDSCSIPGVAAIYMDTSNKGDNVIVGYAGNLQICKPGESRMYSTDTGGALKYFIHIKSDKIIMGAGAPINHLMQWEAFNTALSAYFTAQNTAIGTGIVSAGGTYTPPTAIDISTAKTTNILIN